MLLLSAPREAGRFTLGVGIFRVVVCCASSSFSPTPPFFDPFFFFYGVTVPVGFRELLVERENGFYFPPRVNRGQKKHVGLKKSAWVRKKGSAVVMF